ARDGEPLLLEGADLITWLAKWAHEQRLELSGRSMNLLFHGRIAELRPRLEEVDSELSFTHFLGLPDRQQRPLPGCRFMVGEPPLVLVENEFFLLRNAPPGSLL